MNEKQLKNEEFNNLKNSTKNRDERIPWDQYFMVQALLLSLRSTCERLSVGATLVRNNRIIAGGYNGSVSGDVHCLDEGCYVVDDHCVRTIHAEMNAILQCAKLGIPTDGSVIYVTHFPCLSCTKMLLQAGVKKIYYYQDYRNDPYAERLFKQVGVTIEQVTLDEKYFQEFFAKLFHPAD